MKERLKEYIDEDLVYQEFKNHTLEKPNDFEKFCIQHCEDISEALKIVNNWNNLKQWLKEYRLNKTGSDKDGRYCVAISITDLLNKMEELENNNE